MYLPMYLTNPAGENELALPFGVWTWYLFEVPSFSFCVLNGSCLLIFLVLIGCQSLFFFCCLLSVVNCSDEKKKLHLGYILTNKKALTRLVRYHAQTRSQGFSFEGGRGGKMPWHGLVTCPSYTLKSWVN